MKVKYVKKITDNAKQVRDPHYKYAHRVANEAEKKKNPAVYKKENKSESKMLHHDKHELMAKMGRNGQVEIEDKFKKFTPTLALHEKTEVKEEKKLDKKRNSRYSTQHFKNKYRG